MADETENTAKETENTADETGNTVKETENTAKETESAVKETGRVKSGKREFVGIVKSDKMNKTIVVQVETTALHPLYKKYVTRIKKLKAHDETNDAKAGDRVRVVECRPISKEKCWRLAAILERAQ